MNTIMHRGIPYIEVTGTLTSGNFYHHLNTETGRFSGFLTKNAWPKLRQIADLGQGCYRIRAASAVRFGIIPASSEIMFSNTATQHGYGTASYKWVSSATDAERCHAQQGGIVLFDDGVRSGGSHGTTLRMMVYDVGRYRPRVPSVEIIARYEGEK